MEVSGGEGAREERWGRGHKGVSGLGGGRWEC